MESNHAACSGIFWLFPHKGPIEAKLPLLLGPCD